MDNTIRFEKLSRFDRLSEPCSVAIPFPQGKLADPAGLAILDDGRPLPVQSCATARWQDDSVKWLYADFLVDLPGNKPKTLTWRTDAASPIVPDPPVTIGTENGNTVLETGAAGITLGAPGSQSPIQGIATQGWQLGSDAFQGPCFLDQDGQTWAATLDSPGWRVIRSGPVRATVQASGSHQAPHGDRRLNFTLCIHAFAGKPWFQIDYRLINLAPDEEVAMAGLVLRIRPESPGGDIATSLATSNYRTRKRRGGKNDHLAHCIDAEQLIYESNEQIPEVHYGTFWADWYASPAGGIAATIHQAQQNFPKALEVDADGIDIWLYPTSRTPLSLRPGVARTQRILLHPHREDPDTADINTRSLQFQMPDRPVLSADTYRAAEVFEPVWIDDASPRIEAFLIDNADERSRGYGMLNWGDGPDASYSNQGRGHGKPVWTNNEYDLPHAAMLMFARTGERRMLDYLLVTAEHQMDVDVCHASSDPRRQNGQITHSAYHATGSVVPSHQWVEGLLDLYHVTADREAFDTAIGIGRNLLRHLQRPELRLPAASSARETGWALRALVALYRETGKEEWLDPAAAIVDQFRQWQERYGAWLAPYTDHTLVRVPFMIAVAASSLMRYYWLTGDQSVADLIVTAMRDLIEHSLKPDGRFYYKELPSLQRRSAGIYVLESLAYAYDLTGDTAFLDAGMSTFAETLRTPLRGSGRKIAVDDAVIWDRGPSPKAFASRFLPVVMFYRAATAAGLLTSFRSERTQ